MLAIIVAGLSLNQLSLSKQSEARGVFQTAGESVTALALSELQDDPTFGQPGHPQRSRLFEYKGPSGEKGFLTFDPDIASANGLKPSVNNFSGVVSVDSENRKVPPGMILLRGIGQLGESQASVELLVHRPPFPFAITTTGDLSLEGTAVIGELPPGTDIAQLQPGDPDLFKELLPAHIRANGDINLDGTIVVQGDATAGGQVNLAGNAQVRGDTVTNGGPIAISRVNMNTFDPPAGSFDDIATNFLNSTTLRGRHRFEDPSGGGLLVDGTLQLRDGVLFVDGDLTVRNGIRGSGAVISTGSVSIQGDTQIVGFDRVAVLAQRRILLQGASNSQFQGTVYSNGDIIARNLTIAGPLIGGGSDSDITLDNAILASTNGNIDLSISRRGFHRNATRGNQMAAGFGPQNYSYVEEAEMISSDVARVRRMSFHPNLGSRELGLGEVDLTTGTVVAGSGDLSASRRANGATVVVNHLNQRSSHLEPSTDPVPSSAIQALHYVNYFNRNPADDFDWIRDRSPVKTNASSRNFQFRPNEILSPGQQLKIYHRQMVR